MKSKFLVVALLTLLIGSRAIAQHIYVPHPRVYVPRPRVYAPRPHVYVPAPHVYVAPQPRYHRRRLYDEDPAYIDVRPGYYHRRRHYNNVEVEVNVLRPRHYRGGYRRHGVIGW